MADDLGRSSQENSAPSVGKKSALIERIEDDRGAARLEYEVKSSI